jgi:NAD+ synthase (glutamine-hydrolysing)
MLRITTAQLNYTVGDIEGNVAKMLAAADQALRARADMVVFSELSLTGYYPADLLEEPGFAQRVQAGLDTLLQASAERPELYWVIGAPVLRASLAEADGGADAPGHAPVGKAYYNMLRVLNQGRIVLDYAKQLLPTYNIFDESRHFEPGPDVAPVLRIGDLDCGFLICEDGWNDAGHDYLVNPFARMARHPPDLVVSINGSPSQVGWREERHRVFGDASRRHGLPILYVNQVGGQDQLVYDGASFAAEPERGIVFEAARFAEEVVTLRFEGGRFLHEDGQACAPVARAGMPTLAFYRAQIVLGIRDYARRCGFKQAVIGSSGGIDSALTLALAVEALGAENVSAITMPSAWSSAGSVDDSAVLCERLGVPLHRYPIGQLFDQYSTQFAGSFGDPLDGLAAENLQARIRGTVLMAYSNRYGHLLLTTGNKSEISVGYCTLYGDTNGGLGPIGDLYKTEVFALSRHVNECAGRELIPASIIDKPPSAELAPGQKDTDSLPPYEVLDEMLKWLIEGSRLAPAEFERAGLAVAALRAEPEGLALFERVRRMIARNEYKRRQSPPIIRVRGRAFGVGRQMPIAALHV